MRRIAAKAIILLLAIIIAVILVAPGVNLAPVVSRTDWSACLLVVFMGWLAAIFGRIALLYAYSPSLPRDSLLLTRPFREATPSSATPSLSLRC
ncbi:MAG TPA: hypothetical protein VFY05_08140 [Candidatus Angelobacter sp.]|nr:hypothetical protein [Candidatus Angelobacter sp.]